MEDLRRAQGRVRGEWSRRSTATAGARGARRPDRGSVRPPPTASRTGRGESRGAGRLLGPGDPEAAVQFVDARDPRGVARQGWRSKAPVARSTLLGLRKPLSFAALLDRARAPAIGSDAEVVWVDEQRVLDAGVEGVVGAPRSGSPGPSTAGDGARGHREGGSRPDLAFRPVEEDGRRHARLGTARSTVTGRRSPHEREQEILAGRISASASSASRIAAGTTGRRSTRSSTRR